MNTVVRSRAIPRFVLDAWALLALVQREEPAATRVEELISDAIRRRLDLFLSAINLGEVFYRIGRVRGEDEASRVWDTIRNLTMTIVPATEEAVLAAARFKMNHPISYADAFAVATTDALGATLVTGDPELVALADRIAVERLTRNS